MATIKQNTKAYKAPVPKRTSQGTYNKPKGKHARKNWKQYRGQG
jgi:hypothetical protein